MKNGRGIFRSGVSGGINNKKTKCDCDYIIDPTGIGELRIMELVNQRV